MINLKKNKKIFLSLILFLFLFFPLASQAYDFNIDSGLEDTAEKTGYTMGLYDASLYKEPTLIVIIGNIIGIVLSMIGILFLLLMMYGGYIWLTAQGNEQQVEKAKKIIVSAILGLVIIFASYAISWFIVNAFSVEKIR